MIDRRHLLLGGACVAGAAGAYALKPRKEMKLLTGVTLADAVPRQIDGWNSEDVTDLVAPKEDDSLAARLYGQTVGRVYRNAEGAEIMMLAAYGATQSNQLMLHRPETCYPAVGFKIVSDESVRLPLAQGVSIPTRRLIAETPDRRESISYWARLGEHLPESNRNQRLDRLKTAMEGYVADGLLMRFSGLGEPKAVFERTAAFIPQFIEAVKPEHRKAFVGTMAAATLQGLG